FRGPQGVWTKNPGAEKMATLQHYVADPEVRKRAWKSRLSTFGRPLEPNAGHRALVELERRGTLHTLITQNVDGLHLAAGTAAGRDSRARSRRRLPRLRRARADGTGDGARPRR